jgi:hypothetical protein
MKGDSMSGMCENFCFFKHRKIIALDIYNIKMASEILSKAEINLEIYGSDAETYWDI